MDPKRPFRPTGRNSLLLLLILLIMVAIAILWARSEAPPGEPRPSATVNPPVPPPDAIPKN